jgi:hypothetical protein
MYRNARKAAAGADVVYRLANGRKRMQKIRGARAMAFSESGVKI